jgi:uncharacterized membrane protein
MRILTGSLGPFHPLLVHLPIGFLLLGIIFQWLASIKKYEALLPAVRISYLLGAIAAVLSCISGWVLSSGGEYDAATLAWHRWSAIALTLLSAAVYLLAAKVNNIWQRVMASVLLVLMIVAGHFGGTLTHGEGFLTKGFITESSAKTKYKPLTDINEATVFTDIVQPILDVKCGNCHSAVKQKGGLRLDGREWILKGGKDGPVYMEGDAGNSELYKRLLLGPLEEKHMPPKGKPQLTEQELQLIHWWIAGAAGFDKKVKEVNRDPAMEKLLHRLQPAASSVPAKPDVPAAEVEAAPQEILDSLRAMGISVTPVAANSHYLQVSMVGIQEPLDRHIELLQKAARQTVWLKIPGACFSAAGWKILAGFTSLTRLSLEYASLDDEAVAGLSNLSSLQYLNLAGTKVSGKGVTLLKDLKDLAYLYLGNTYVDRRQFLSLRQLFPHTMMDSGNYSVSTLAIDTQLVKAPVKKKK